MPKSRKTAAAKRNSGDQIRWPGGAIGGETKGNGGGGRDIRTESNITNFGVVKREGKKPLNGNGRELRPELDGDDVTADVSDFLFLYFLFFITFEI